MKLVVMIPALNEEETVGAVVRSIPRQVDGISEVEVLVCSDGSTDRTVEEAQLAKADRVLRFRRTQGLATTFKLAMLEALRMGADVIVNIDGDAQYEASELPRLIEPILMQEADIVLGSRFLGTIEEMPRAKRFGNIFGTWVVKRVSAVPITDAQTGYRAFTRHAALLLNVLAEHTYTQETIIEAAHKHLKVVEVPVTFKRRSSGSSRLVKNFWNYGKRAAFTVGAAFAARHARAFLAYLGVASFLGSLALGGRVLVHFFGTGQVTPFLPSAILAGFLAIFGVQLMVLAVIAGMISRNRTLIDDILYVIKDRRE